MASEATKQQGQQELAAQLWCDLLKRDKTDEDAQQMCPAMTKEADKFRKKVDQLMSDGIDALNKGDLETAEQKFKNVKGGSRFEEAQQNLQRIAGARNEGQAFEGAVAAFNAGDMNKAADLFAKVSGP